VKHSFGPKLFLAAAFVLTLALKLIAHPVSANPDDLSRAVSAFLLQQGFETDVEQIYGNFLIHADAGKCRMLIREAAPQGWDHSSIELTAKLVGRLSYVFEGVVYEQQPFLAPMIGDYWTRARSKMGFSASRHPILAVAASDDCSINALPWWELSVPS
jgi:hypothetical protein